MNSTTRKRRPGRRVFHGPSIGVDCGKAIGGATVVGDDMLSHGLDLSAQGLGKESGHPVGALAIPTGSAGVTRADENVLTCGRRWREKDFGRSDEFAGLVPSQ
ncbi:hypothetical protein [Nocardia sp. MW-W600-9]